MIDDPSPTFFAGRRMSVYFRGGRLMKDRKTEQRFWRLKWALTLKPADAYACRGAIQSTYEHIQARENAAEEIILGGARGEMIVRAFALAEGGGAAQIIRLDRCYLDQFRMTYADDMTEFWMQVEHELTDSLHTFVKNYAFQRFWVEFETAQRSLVETPQATVKTNLDFADFADALQDELLDGVHGMQQRADESGITTRITSEGKTLAEFKPKGKVQ